MLTLSGSMVALITPMENDGRIDHQSLQKLIEYHIKSGSSAIVVMGTTGESATLTHAEYIDVIASTVAFTSRRIPVIAGTGANATAKAVALTKSVAELGVDGCLTVTPSYNRPTQEGLYHHFKAIAECSALPQILYNIPARTGCDMLPETVARLAKLKNIVAIKEATGDLKRVEQIKQLVKNKNFALLSGDDISGLDFMCLGGSGIISVTANIAAREMAELCNFAAFNDFASARRINRHLFSLHKILSIESNPIPVKWACQQLRLIKTANLRLPMMSLSGIAQKKVKAALQKAGLLSI